MLWCVLSIEGLERILEGGLALMGKVVSLNSRLFIFRDLVYVPSILGEKVLDCRSMH